MTQKTLADTMTPKDLEGSHGDAKKFLRDQSGTPLMDHIVMPKSVDG